MIWLNHKRLTIYPRFFVCAYLVYYLVITMGGAGQIDREGLPIGHDFSHYWIASSLALNGEPAAVYDYSRLEPARTRAFGQARVGLPWLYPPTYLLMVLPIALMPYLVALAVCLLGTLGGYLWIVHRIAPHPFTVWLTLAFPGTFQNLIFGQNGFLSAILLGGGLLLLEQFPFIAGLLLGLFTYKIHFALLIPVALIAGRRWRALTAMATSAMGLFIASLIVLGTEVWIAFFKNIPFTLNIMQSPNLHWHNRPTIFSALMLAGAGNSAATIIQLFAMIVVMAMVAWVWHQRTEAFAMYSILVIGILLFPPYAAVYDLTLLSLPLSWLGWEGYSHGWRRGQQTLLILGWSTPLLTPIIAKTTYLQTAPLVLGALLVFILWQEIIKKAQH